jgi:hypothetical protein
MDVCRKEVPPLVPRTGTPTSQADASHLDACFLDDETKEREAEKLRAGRLAEAS